MRATMQKVAHVDCLFEMLYFLKQCGSCRRALAAGYERPSVVLICFLVENNILTGLSRRILEVRMCCLVRIVCLCW